MHDFRPGPLDALAEIGPPAEGAVPTLIDLLGRENDPSTYKVAEALGRIGPAVAGAIAQLEGISARSEDEGLRTTADLALWRITRGEKGVASLIKELKGSFDLARTLALTTLGQIDPGAEPAVPSIAEFLRDDHLDPLQVTRTLGQIGLSAKATLPILIKIFKDDAFLYKDDIADAIRAIDPGTAMSFGIR